MYSETLHQQKKYFDSNITKDIKFRKKQLKKLLQVLKDNEDLLCDAIYKDFKKSSFDTYSTELGLIYSELKHSIKELDVWAQKKHVRTNLANIPGSSYIMSEPLGNILVIGAWNYPYLLSLHPVVSAMAAGNTVIIKPSELSENTSRVMAELINSHFSAEYLHVIEGGVEETTEILKLKFDKIFYTGSSMVAKIVMRAAAAHLCPVTLELGGKSPVIVTKSASIKMAAKRIVWGKFINNGQTCVAPDYLIVDQSVKEKLIEEIKKQIIKIHSKDAKTSEALPRIINRRHFDRLMNLIDKNKVIHGGESDADDLYIAPTLMDKVNWGDKVMQEEIFGPILPILDYKNLEEAIQQIKAYEKPLALYLFSNKRKTRDRVFGELSFGGGGLNETIMQFANPNLPFGGVGYSGMGNYHGEFGFKGFSHEKSIIQKPNWFEPFIKYPPYTKLKTNLFKKIM